MIRPEAGSIGREKTGYWESAIIGAGSALRSRYGTVTITHGRGQESELGRDHLKGEIYKEDVVRLVAGHDAVFIGNTCHWRVGESVVGRILKNDIMKKDITKKDTLITRRQSLTAIGMGLGAAAAPNLFAAPDQTAAPERGGSASEKADIGAMSPQVNFTLAGKTALVTGAARGIGRAISVGLAAAGADVLGFDICAAPAPNLVYPPATAAELEETGRMVQGQKRRWIGVKGDIRDMAALRGAVERATKEFGKLDIAIANAAIQMFGPLVEVSDEDWKNEIDINLTGTANTLRAVLPHMLQRKYGRIVVLSSGQGRKGNRNGAAYAASKWGIIGLMKSAAWEVARNGITINSVQPGLVETPLTRNSGRWKKVLEEAGLEGKENPTEQEVIAARRPEAVIDIPWMQPNEVAPAIVFLCTDAARCVTGCTYDISAGDSVKYTA